MPDWTSAKGLLGAAARARRRFASGAGVPLPVLAQKSLEYGLSLATAPVYLWAVNRVGRNVRTIGRPRIENYGTIEIGDGVVLRSALLPLELATSVGGRITIGADTFINYGTAIGAAGDLRIGERVNIAPFVTILDTTYHDPYDRKRVPPARAVTICDDAFIGAKASVMPGVTIGEGAIVATGAVVTHDVKPFTIVAGVPAKVVEELDPARFVRHDGAE